MPLTATKSTIIYRAAPNETAAVLSNSSLCRKLEFGTAWNSVRVGIRAYVRRVPASPDLNVWTGNAPYGNFSQLGIGLSSGVTPARNTTASHWVGAISTGIWQEFDQGAQNYTLQFTGFRAAKKVGATTTVGGVDLAANRSLSAGALHGLNFARTLMFVDIIKGSPNFSFRLFACGNAATAGDASRATFLAQMEAAPPALGSYTYTAAQTLAVDEADGVLDSINIFYSRTGPEIELCDIAFARLT